MTQQTIVKGIKRINFFLSPLFLNWLPFCYNFFSCCSWFHIKPKDDDVYCLCVYTVITTMYFLFQLFCFFHYLCKTKKKRNLCIKQIHIFSVEIYFIFSIFFSCFFPFFCSNPVFQSSAKFSHLWSGHFTWSDIVWSVCTLTKV